MNGIWRKTFRWLDCMYFVAQNSTKEPYKSRATTSASVLKGETWEWETSNNQKKKGYQTHGQTTPSSFSWEEKEEQTPTFLN